MDTIQLNPAQSAPPSAAPKGEQRARRMPKLPVLDGWRGISIVLVLMSHMLPLGPAGWALNNAVGVVGMAIFFTLSGFLITSTLYFNPSVRVFAIRRLLRIVPAAWLYIVVVLSFFAHASLATWSADLLFYTNLPPFHLGDFTSHLWSLCIEVQFYLAIGLLFFLLRKRGLALLPLFCVAITLGRIYIGAWISITTLFRVDEILSGASLAYLFHSDLSARLKQVLHRLNPAVPLVLLLLSSHPALPWLNYLRPYFAATMVGTTLFHSGTWWNRVLESRRLAYVAAISYALYIWHPITMHGWFESGSKLAKYAKRPLALAISFLLAHLSTFYFEKHFIRLGKRLTDGSRMPVKPEPAPAG